MLYLYYPVSNWILLLKGKTQLKVREVFFGSSKNLMSLLEEKLKNISLHSG